MDKPSKLSKPKLPYLVLAIINSTDIVVLFQDELVCVKYCPRVRYRLSVQYLDVAEDVISSFQGISQKDPT